MMKSDANDVAREGPGKLKERLQQMNAETAPYPVPALKLRTYAGENDGAPILRSLADIPPEELRWLWPGRIPLGKMTILCGDPGLGKSFVTLDIAARVSTGGIFPDVSQAIEAGHVILLNAEDDAADTIRPRLDKLKADVTRISILDGVKFKGGKKYFNLQSDLSALEVALQQHSDTRQVIVDPIR